MKNFLDWWVDNLKRPSTWCGLFLVFISYEIWNDTDALHLFLMQIVKDPNFVGIVVSLISGALIAHKR